MKHIRQLDLSAFNNRELEKYFSDALDIIKSEIKDDLYVINVFSSSLDSFKSSLEDSDIRDKISLIQLDSRVDRAWRAIQAQLKADEMQHLEDVIEAARQVGAIFMKTGDPTRLPYNDEQDALKNLIANLRELSPEILEKAHVAHLIDHLDALCGAFLEASELCGELKAMHELKDNRFGLIDIWGMVVNSLESRDDTDLVIDKINHLSSELTIA